MAGNNQHFIPQFLQRGFGANPGRATHTWVFRANQAPSLEPIKHVGAEHQFYTDVDDREVDDTITKAENRFANLTNLLRSVASGPVTEPMLPDFLAHLEVRTRHLRDVYLQNTDFVLNRLFDYMADADRFVALVERRMVNDPQWLRGFVIREARKRGSASRDFSGYVNGLMKVARAAMPALLEKQKPKITLFAKSFRSVASALLPAVLKKGHIRALKRSIHPEIHARLFSPLRFRVIDTAPFDMILGDAAVLFRLDGARSFGAFTEKGARVRAAFLPLATGRLLIAEDNPAQWDLSEIRRSIAATSAGYFIGHADSPENRALCPTIGRNSSPLGVRELEQLALECFESFAEQRVLK